MPESKATGPKKWLESHHSRGTETHPHALPGNLSLVDSASDQQNTQPLFLSEQQHNNQPDTPSWVRPFLSLRTQLTLTYSLLLVLLVAFTYLLLDQHAPSPVMLPAIIGVVVAGSILSFVLTSLLLRPLSRVTDVAQAIAIGDLAQRDRLPLHLPPQDEIDRLAGSLNEMVIRLERAEEMQQASEERFRQFFTDASHQLRTPLTSIRGFTELLMRGAAKDDPETSQHILARMKSESERMTLLINDLLTLARLNDTHPPKLQYLDLVKLAAESIEQARILAKDDRKITLALETDERMELHADKERITQLLFILLDNALKYGRPAPDGEITLKLSKQRGHISLFVIDNGEGIIPDEQEHIFEAFYRGRHRSSSQTKAVIGTGLGLTIASAIVRAHNGAITVCSEVGHTEFKILLPGTD
ncbi:MAG TPA: HAMP domain-containing sensor histidine kinase [Dictyobacter sp.]|nr:HAMP domain-containing sensor histidine kinase [Dictyobacter sp.]